MATIKWDPAKILGTAARSGKPLEVECAQAFTGANAAGVPGKWEVFLSSHYEDRATDKIRELIRELDVLARRRAQIDLNDQKIECVMEVYLSCKGFPGEEVPISYSVSRESVPEIQKPLVLHHINPPGRFSSLGVSVADYLLYETKQQNDKETLRTRRIVGFDVIKHPGPKKDGSEPDLYDAKGDRALFEGLDSALKAALYWNNRVKNPTALSARLGIPLLILSKDWWDISIDGGKMGEPEEQSVGYVANLYPVRGGEMPPDPLMCLIASRNVLGPIMKVLLDLFAWFTQRAEEAYRSPR